MEKWSALLNRGEPSTALLMVFCRDSSNGPTNQRTATTRTADASEYFIEFAERPRFLAGDSWVRPPTVASYNP
jgi:hypothetical protein